MNQQYDAVIPCDEKSPMLGRSQDLKKGYYRFVVFITLVLGFVFYSGQQYGSNSMNETDDFALNDIDLNDISLLSVSCIATDFTIRGTGVSGQACHHDTTVYVTGCLKGLGRYMCYKTSSYVGVKKHLGSFTKLGQQFTLALYESNTGIKLCAKHGIRRPPPFQGYHKLWKICKGFSI